MYTRFLVYCYYTSIAGKGGKFDPAATPPTRITLADLTHMIGFDRDIPEGASWHSLAAHHTEHYPARD